MRSSESRLTAHRHEQTVLDVLPLLRGIGFNAFHDPRLTGFITALYPDGVPERGNVDEAQHDTGGRRPVRWREDSEVIAKFSGPCAEYRDALVEVWDVEKPLWMWVLMNPSMAGLRFTDSTVNRTGKISRNNGAGGQIIANTGAYRATKPTDLIGKDAVGPENIQTILQLVPAASKIILAYGLPPAELAASGPMIAKLLAERQAPLYYLRRRLDGRPMHPLARGKSGIPLDIVPKRWGE